MQKWLRHLDSRKIIWRIFNETFLFSNTGKILDLWDNIIVFIIFLPLSFSTGNGTAEKQLRTTSRLFRLRTVSNKNMKFRPFISTILWLLFICNFKILKQSFSLNWTNLPHRQSKNFKLHTKNNSFYLQISKPAFVNFRTIFTHGPRFLPPIFYMWKKIMQWTFRFFI